MKKGLAVGIVVLLSMSIALLGSSLSFGKTMVNEKMNPESVLCSRQFNFTITGTMGENGWYVSGVVITITGNESPYWLYFFIDNGSWIKCTGPIEVTGDGIHIMYFLLVFLDGSSVVMGPYVIKIDKTPPVIINVTAIKLNLSGTKWLLNTDVIDPTSGLSYVEFYVDDVLVGNVTSPPWGMLYQGKGKVVQVIVYDNAGNDALSPMISLPLVLQPSQSQNSPNIQQKTILLQNLVYNLFHQRMNGWNQ